MGILFDEAWLKAQKEVDKEFEGSLAQKLGLSECLSSYRKFAD